jgi:hypothetical protein
MKMPRVPLSILLPAVALVIWLVLIPTQAFVCYRKLSYGVPESGIIRFDAGEFGVAIPREHLFQWLLQSAALRNSTIVQAINLPGLLAWALIAKAVFHSVNQHPASYLPNAWRAMYAPFVCLPFWWLSGRSFENALGFTRSKWQVLIAGTLLFALIFALFLEMRFDTPESDLADLEWILIGSVIWSLALIPFPFAAFRRWRGRVRRQKVDKESSQPQQ